MNNSAIPHIIVIGGGFSGVVLSMHLINKAKSPIKISIVEKSSIMANGVAYSTTHPKHLLNVPVENMGALSDDPLHFFNWIKNNRAVWKNLDSEFESLEIQKGDFVPRMIYGAYLTSIWNETLLEAKIKQCELIQYTDEVINLEVLEDKNFEVILLSGALLKGDYVVLATGVPENKEFKLDVKSGDSSHYIKSIWLDALPEFKAHSTIAMIGTSLTMIDALLSACNAIDAKFIAISKDGKPPEPHLKNLPVYPSFMDSHHLPKTALELFRKVRAEISQAAKKGIDWRTVLDSLRPFTVMLWQNLNLKERKKFLKYFSNTWNSHRHRRPKLYENELKNVKFVEGLVDSIEIHENEPVTIKIKFNSSIQEEKADYVINCSGPEMNIFKTNSLLFKNLIKNHLIIGDLLNMGIAADNECRVLGNGNGHFFAIGLILLGNFFETVAVPELRVQCNVVASEILKL